MSDTAGFLLFVVSKSNIRHDSGADGSGYGDKKDYKKVTTHCNIQVCDVFRELYLLASL